MIEVAFADTCAIVEAGSGTDGAESRTIRGVAAPWNQVGTVSDGTQVMFAPGSLDAAARPIVTIGHSDRAIGRTADNVASDAGMSTTVRVSRVRDGDEALTLAADGVLGMFSVGVNPTEFHYDDDGVMVVDAADWHHTALLPFGAFAAATVTDVAASQPNPEGSPMTDTLTADTPTPTVEAAPVDRPAIVPVTAPRPAAPLTLHRVAELVAGANRGEIPQSTVRATLEAALANVTTADIAGIVQPVYRSEILTVIDHGTPLLNALASAPLPPSGMSIEYPQWDNTAPNGGMPTTGIQAVEKTAIVSTPVKMVMKSNPVITIAGGNDISLQAMERSSPSFLEAYLRAAAADWARKASAYVIDKLDDGAVTATPGTAFLENVQALLAALDPALTPAGPLFVAMSYDVAIPMISVQQPDGPAFWNGTISFGSMTPSVSADGLELIVDTSLPAGTMIGGSKQAATVYKSAGAPADIRVVDVSLLGLDVGVYGYLAVAVEYPKAIAKMTGIVPLGASSTSAKAKS